MGITLKIKKGTEYSVYGSMEGIKAPKESTGFQPAWVTHKRKMTDDAPSTSSTSHEQVKPEQLGNDKIVQELEARISQQGKDEKLEFIADSPATLYVINLGSEPNKFKDFLFGLLKKNDNPIVAVLGENPDNDATIKDNLKVFDTFLKSLSEATKAKESTQGVSPDSFIRLEYSPDRYNPPKGDNKKILDSAVSQIVDETFQILRAREPKFAETDKICADIGKAEAMISEVLKTTGQSKFPTITTYSQFLGNLKRQINMDVYKYVKDPAQFWHNTYKKALKATSINKIEPPNVSTFTMFKKSKVDIAKSQIKYILNGMDSKMKAEPVAAPKAGM